MVKDFQNLENHGEKLSKSKNSGRTIFKSKFLQLVYQMKASNTYIRKYIPDENYVFNDNNKSKGERIFETFHALLTTRLSCTFESRRIG